MNICIYSLGGKYNKWGTVVRHNMLVNENKMVIGGNLNEFNLVKKTQYFIPYKSKKIFNKDGQIFEDIYEKISEPIKVDSINKWLLAFNNGINYYDNVKDKPIEPLEGFKNLINNGNYDIVWYVRKIKKIKLKQKDFKHLFINKRLSKISIDNIHYLEIKNLIDNSK